MDLRLKSFFIILAVATTVHSQHSFAAAGDQSQTFTLEGELYNSPTGSVAFTGGADIQVRILDESKNCVLYAEEQHVDTTTSAGIFNIEIGSSVADPDGKRIAGSDSGNSMVQVFQNRLPINATGAGCGGPTYTPSVGGGDGRYLEISVTPTATGLTDVLSPDIYLGSVPTAISAQTIQGLAPSDIAILKPGTTELTQANLEDVFSLTNFPLLQAAIAAGGGGGGATTSTTDTTLNADSDSNGSGSLLFQTRGTTRAEVKNDGDFAVDTNTLYVESTSNKVGIGSTVPSFDLSFGGDIDRMIGLERNSAGTNVGQNMFVESGGATTGIADKRGGDLYLSSGIATGTGDSAIYFSTATPGAAGITDRDPTLKMTLDGNGRLGIGTATPTEKLSVVGDNSAAVILNTIFDSALIPTYRSQKARGTLAAPLIVASGDAVYRVQGQGYDGAAYQSAAEVRMEVDGTPGAGDMPGRMTFSTTADGAASLIERMRLDSQGDFGIGVNDPTATLHLRAGTTTKAPLKFNLGVNLTTPEAGALEYDGTNIYFTDNALSRKTLATTSGGSFTSVSSIANAAGNITLSPQAATGYVTVDSGTASTGTTNGALVVNGGVGVSGNLNAGGSMAVTGSVTTSDVFVAPLGTNLLPSYTFAADLNTGMFSPGADLVAIATGGTERLRVIGSGYVGIGTPTPGANLHILSSNTSGGGLIVENTSNGTVAAANLTLRNDTSQSGSFKMNSSAASSLGAEMANALSIRSSGITGVNIAAADAAGRIRFYTGGDAAANERMRIDAAGFVGIGITPLDKFHVSGNSLFEGNVATRNGGGLAAYDSGNDRFVNMFVVNDAESKITTSAGHLNLAPFGNIGAGVTTPTAALHLKAGTATASTAPLKFSTGVNLTTPESGAIEFDGTNLYFTNSTPTRMTIATTSGGGAYTNVTSITGSGALSVTAGGTNQALTLNGSGTGGVTTSGITTITNATASTTSATGALVVTGGVGVGGNVTTAGTFIAPLGAAGTPSYTFSGDTNTGMFSVTDILGFATSGTEKMRIDASGNVGIGATPTAKLDVQGGSIRSTDTGGASKTNATAAIDWSKGNNQNMTVACTATTFTNMLDGATYNLFVKETTATTCVFSQAGLTFYYAPVNASRLAGLTTLYSFTRIGTDVMVSWTVMNP